MTTASSPRSSRETWTIRPNVFPFYSNTLNALNMSLIHLRLHLEPCVPRFLDGSFVLNRRDVAGIAIEAALNFAIIHSASWPSADVPMMRPQNFGCPASHIDGRHLHQFVVEQ